MLPQPLAIVGAGRLGTAIAGALRAAGVAVSGPHGRGYRGVGDRPPPAAPVIAAPVIAAPLVDAAVLLCVPDDAIADAAAMIVAGPLLGHCSGASGLDVLGERAGFSVHPLMTVTSDGADFTGVTAAVDGSTDDALAAATAIARALGLHPVRVAGVDRVAYHAAASFAANFLVTVESAAAELMSTAGLDRAVLLPLARAALENWGRSGSAALTGPVARGDLRTVARHREAVASRAPELIGLFDMLVEATGRLADRNPVPSAEPPPPVDEPIGAAPVGHDSIGADATREPRS